MPSGRRRPLPRTAVLITNPGSGTGHTVGDRRLIRDAIEARGVTVLEELTLAQLDQLDSLLHIPAEERPLVVAAGGDGTLGTVVDHLANTGTVLGIVPTGTSNNVARSLGIPLEVRGAVALFTEGKVASVDLGRLIDSEGGIDYFLQAATMGLQVEFARLATRPSLRHRLGRLTYVAAIMVALWRTKPVAYELVAEQKTSRLRLLHLSIFNAPVFGGGLSLRLPGSDLDDRNLDVLAVEAMPLPRLLVLGVLVMLRKGRRHSGIHSFRTEAIEVRAAAPQDVALDGEVTASLPARFEVAPEALLVVTPLDFEDRDD
jgi:YegS/Rv2252/BmrU family lipid kinase